MKREVPKFVCQREPESRSMWVRIERGVNKDRVVRFKVASAQDSLAFLVYAQISVEVKQRT